MRLYGLIFMHSIVWYILLVCFERERAVFFNDQILTTGSGKILGA